MTIVFIKLEKSESSIIQSLMYIYSKIATFLLKNDKIIKIISEKYYFFLPFLNLIALAGLNSLVACSFFFAVEGAIFF